MDDITLLIKRKQAAARLPAPTTRRFLREITGLSLRDVGDLLGVCPTSVLRWERALVQPRSHNAQRYASLLDRLARESGVAGQPEA